MQGVFASPAMLCYLVGVNKWTVIKSLNYLVAHNIDVYSPLLVKCVRILLAKYEAKFAIYTFPSISLQYVVTCQFQMVRFISILLIMISYKL